uniref:Uncharacterized protein n=1 Tax=Arundo donax TaxID=35708 RepID=A0A0A9BDW9_ARUDO
MVTDESIPSSNQTKGLGSEVGPDDPSLNHSSNQTPHYWTSRLVHLFYLCHFSYFSHIRLNTIL